MKKHVLLYGLAVGASVSVLMLLSFSMWNGEDPDFSMGEITGYASMLLSFLLLFVGVKRYRDRQMNGYITFWKALGMGLLMTLIASAIYVAGWLIYSANMSTDFMEQYSQYMIDKMKADGVSESEIIAKSEQMAYYGELYKNPLWKMAFTFLEIFPVGFIVSVITALILKKRP